MTSLARLLEVLGHRIEDVDEEVFELFTLSHSTQDLGMLDAKATEVEVCINGKDFTIKQSPGILTSNRETGTTGAVVWRTSVHFAEWLAHDDNVLFQTGMLQAEGTFLELGSGISALVPSVLQGKVKRVIATDQQYSLRLLQENIDANIPAAKTKPEASRKTGNTTEVLGLDWEIDDITAFLNLHHLDRGVDVLAACDCIFNYALIEPLVNTCAEICEVRKKAGEGEPAMTPTICVIAQQLRQPDVFEQWLKAFMDRFDVWRVPGKPLKAGTEHDGGYVIHIGVLQPSKA